MAKKKKKDSSINLDNYKKTRTRAWLIKPITQVVPNRKAKNNKAWCRGKVDSDG